MRGVVLLPNSSMDIFWLDDNYEMNHSTWNNINQIWPAPPTVGQFDNLGGVFTSAPAAVATASNRLHVFGLGLDYALYHKTCDPARAGGGSSWTPDWENLGGNLSSTPVVVSTEGESVDVFVLGSDQAMLHTTWSGSSWSAWGNLGGCFTSLPVVLPSGANAFDIFARGADFMIYHMALNAGVSSGWSLLGGPLLWEPTAASAPAAARVGNSVFVFVVGIDAAMWQIEFDGKVWQPWKSLGIAAQATYQQGGLHNIGGKSTPAVCFTSEPTAFGFFAESIVVNPGAGSGGATTGVRAIAPPAPLPPRLRV